MATADAFYGALEDCLRAGETVAVATIVRTRGSSPREVGARMLVRADGATRGTVGGGCGEADVWRTALDVIEDGQARTVTVDLTEDISMSTDGVCGGIMDIFVEPWAAAHDRRRLATELLDALAARRPAIVATVVDAADAADLGRKLVLVDGRVRHDELGSATLAAAARREAVEVAARQKSELRRYAEGSLFFELLLPRPTLVIVGAGHVAQPLAEVGKLLEFDVVVVDDRPSFANADRFPSADRIIIDDFEAALDGLEITPSTSVVLVTRGHVHDVRSLRKIIHEPAGYIGMIGSRRRVFAVFKLLHEEGVPVEQLLRVHAPIGLDIKTETPAEIAVSVGAELVKVRRGGGAASFSDRLREQYRASLTRGAAEPLAR
jgi:xanthine dehydrogenase accessory factor